MNNHPPYKISDRILVLIASISEKIGEVNAAYLTKPPTYLRKSNRLKTIQSSLEIEGNTLSLDQVSEVFDNKRVLGPEKDVLEVRNAVNLYKGLITYNPFSITSFKRAHSVLMKDLIDKPGRFRGKSVGIIKGSQMAHIAPDSSMVNPLMKNLFGYLKNHQDLTLIKSCVFHYEMEFIHPFEDGNGRMGRFWQNVVLCNKYPIFEYISIESMIKERQDKYYQALGSSDAKGQSTGFIEFMLEIIDLALGELLRAGRTRLTDIERLGQFLKYTENKSFSRKDYLKFYPDLSPATASRDLKEGVDQGLLKKSGHKNTTKYQSI